MSKNHFSVRELLDVSKLANAINEAKDELEDTFLRGNLWVDDINGEPVAKITFMGDEIEIRGV
jgi:hypothetical protein